MLLSGEKRIKRMEKKRIIQRGERGREREKESVRKLCFSRMEKLQDELQGKYCSVVAQNGPYGKWERLLTWHTIEHAKLPPPPSYNHRTGVSLMLVFKLF